MDKRLWLKSAAGLSFFMAICQTVISLSPAAAAYFEAPPPLLENRMQLFLMGEAAALIFAVFGFYALSGARSIPHLPLLRLGLIGISRNCICGRDCLELERDANSQINLPHAAQHGPAQPPPAGGSTETIQ